MDKLLNRVMFFTNIALILYCVISWIFFLDYYTSYIIRIFAFLNLVLLTFSTYKQSSDEIRKNIYGGLSYIVLSLILILDISIFDTI